MMANVKVLKTPVKSEGDKKDYRLIELSNGLKALLISKPVDGSGNDELAAACLKVGVGAFSDKPKVLGLAHFLEHMLFLGSEKYPEESSYDHFISLNGGGNNAMTENELTYYFFNVSEDAFSEAIDRFSQQFISPLFLKSSLQREREAVDSEFNMAKSDDDERIDSFFKILIREDHPASHFNFGNLSTLKDGLTDDELHSAVRELFQDYIANNMWLTIQSRRSLNDLQQLTVERFSDIKSGEVLKREHQGVEEILKPEFFNKIYFVKPKKESKQFILTWYFDLPKSDYKCRPLSYLEAIFMNEGEGGLVNYLKAKQLAVSAKLDIDSKSFAIDSVAVIKLAVELTDLGLDHIGTVLESIFSYLLMIKETSIEEHRRLFNAIKEKSEMKFKFHKENDAWDNVIEGAKGMNKFEAEDILRSESVYQEFSEETILKVINAMNQRKFNLTIFNGNHESFPKKTKYFEVEYDDQDFPEEFNNLWNERKSNPDFFLEKPNPFTATNFEIYVNEDESPKYPHKIYETAVFDVWHKLDNDFAMPQAHVGLNIISPKHLTSAYDSLLLKLFEKVLSSTLKKKTYSANSAGLRTYTRTSLKGLEMFFIGYNEKMSLLVDVVTQTIRNFHTELDESLFEIQKAETKKTYKNSLLNAEALEGDFIAKCLRTEYWTKLECYKFFDTVKVEDLQKFIVKFFSHMKIQVLVQGNITKTQALEIVAILEKNLECEALDENYSLQTRGFQLPIGKNVMRMKSNLANDDNSNSIIYYQVGQETLRVNCILKLLEPILNTKAFEFLRTKQQLGYSVDVSVYSHGQVAGICLMVESQEHKHPYQKVFEKMEKFFSETALKIVEDLNDEDFQSRKDGTVDLLLSKKLNLSTEIESNWEEITKFRYIFDQAQISAKITKGLTKFDIQEFFRSMVHPEKTRKLSIQVIGDNLNEDQPKSEEVYNLTFLDEKLSHDENVILDIEGFQSNLMIYSELSSKIE